MISLASSFLEQDFLLSAWLFCLGWECVYVLFKEEEQASTALWALTHTNPMQVHTPTSLA